jgi:hypothetical protein
MTVFIIEEIGTYKREYLAEGDDIESAIQVVQVCEGIEINNSLECEDGELTGRTLSDKDMADFVIQKHLKEFEVPEEEEEPPKKKRGRPKKVRK